MKEELKGGESEKKRLLCRLPRVVASTTALTVGIFRGQGCERSELPCLSFGGGELGRRSWSFYI